MIIKEAADRVGQRILIDKTFFDMTSFRIMRDLCRRYLCLDYYWVMAARSRTCCLTMGVQPRRT